ncbi:MAG TPA: hypothetical protein VFV99_23895 [Kofleriaceae bacterium]|nr:hypothetical protein [Kofleriaceae bacterium]
MSDAADGTDNGDARRDAGVTETRVTGVMYGMPFTLQYASIKRASSTDPLNWVCVADVPSTYDQCSMTGGPERFVFLGPFIYENGVPKWAIVQVWLYHVGTSYSKSADSGMFQILVDNPTTGEFQLTLDVDFAETPHTVGSVLIPGA